MINGWMSEPEQYALSEWSRDKHVLEIGSYEGLSSTNIAKTAKSLTCVDTFDGRATPNLRDTLAQFQKNMLDYDNVFVLIGESKVVVPFLQAQYYDMVFIDADHSYEAVKLDSELARRVLKGIGYLCFHDYGTDHPGVTKLVNELLAYGWSIYGRVGSLIRLTRY